MRSENYSWVQAVVYVIVVYDLVLSLFVVHHMCAIFVCCATRVTVINIVLCRLLSLQTDRVDAIGDLSWDDVIAAQQEYQ